MVQHSSFPFSRADKLKICNEFGYTGSSVGWLRWGCGEGDEGGAAAGTVRPYKSCQRANRGYILCTVDFISFAPYSVVLYFRRSISKNKKNIVIPSYLI